MRLRAKRLAPRKTSREVRQQVWSLLAGRGRRAHDSGSTPGAQSDLCHVCHLPVSGPGLSICSAPHVPREIRDLFDRQAERQGRKRRRRRYGLFHGIEFHDDHVKLYHRHMLWTIAKVAGAVVAGAAAGLAYIVWVVMDMWNDIEGGP